MKVDLFVNDANQGLKPVTAVELPPAMREPEAIFWDHRFFVRQFVAGSGNYQYVEGFVWTAPFPGVPGVDVRVEEHQDGGDNETSNT